jgi:N4-gp56 family major capsid protein
MAVQTTSNLSNSLRNVYKGKYLQGAKAVRLYDQIATPYTEIGADGKTMDQLMQGTTIYVPFLSDMTPGSSAISQTTDVTPQTLTDATATVTHTSRGEALQWSQQLTIEAYTDYTAAAYEKVGMNAMETIESLAIESALAGSFVERYVARASIDAGTAAHRASDAVFRKYDGMLQMMRAPGYELEDGGQVWSAIMHPFVFHDISESGNVDSIGLYQDKGIHLNWELGQIGRFRLLSSPYAKVFGAAGADNATNAATTLSVAASALATSFQTVGDETADYDAGLFWWIGTEETANTFYPTNEPVRILSATSDTEYTFTILGTGPNGGLRYAHPAGTAVRNADSVYTILFAGPQSLTKVFATDVGEYGMTVGPKQTGLLDQFNSLGWKFYGGYGRISEHRLLRYECSTSYEA